MMNIPKDVDVAPYMYTSQRIPPSTHAPMHAHGYDVYNYPIQLTKTLGRNGINAHYYVVYLCHFVALAIFIFGIIIYITIYFIKYGCNFLCLV